MGIIETNEVNFLKTLKKHKYENIVIHYNCENCDDEQVTYNEEVTDDMIEQFKPTIGESNDYIDKVWNHALKDNAQNK